MNHLKISVKEGAWFFHCKDEMGQHWINLYLVQTAHFYGNNPTNAQIVLNFRNRTQMILSGQTAINCWAEFELMRSRAMRRIVG